MPGQVWVRCPVCGSLTLDPRSGECDNPSCGARPLPKEER